MSIDGIDCFSYLWGEEKNNYVLVRVSRTKDAGFVICKKSTRGVLLIDDDEIENVVIQKMIEHGVPICDSMA